MTAQAFIDELGGATAVARELGIPMTTVDTWRRRNRVPQWRIPSLAALASRKGLAVPAGLSERAAA